MSDLSRYSHPGNAKGWRGRPICVADIDFSIGPDIEFYNRFFKACSTFTYREIMALSRVLKCTPRTVQNWKYESHAPRSVVMHWVIRWGELGRPLLRWNNGMPGRPVYVADVEAVEGKRE